MGYIRQSTVSRFREVFSNVGTTSGVLCPELDSSVEEKHGAMKESLKKGCKGDEGPGAPFLQGKPGRELELFSLKKRRCKEDQCS